MQTILFFISSTRHTCIERLEGVYNYTRKRGWHVHVVERAFQKVNVRQQIDFWRPIGAIAECGSGADELNTDSFGGLPVVYFDADRKKRGPGYYVGPERGAVGSLAAEHLLSLGFDSYAFAAFRLPLFWSNERRDTFVSAVRKAGKSCSVFDPGVEQPPSVRQAALADWVESLPRPCGIFAANDYVGEELLNACALKGISVPDDAVILGVDNDETICENTLPSLSSIVPDFEKGGYLAAELLGLLVDGKKPRPQFRSFGVSRIATRQSTRRIACDRRRIADAVEMIRIRACDGISVGDVVAFIGEPRRTAEMHFREATGRSIHEEIDEVRFAKVFSLLKNPRQSLNAIPDLCGFAAGVTLRKAFRLRTGLSMREWRKRH